MFERFFERGEREVQERWKKEGKRGILHLFKLKSRAVGSSLCGE